MGKHKWGQRLRFVSGYAVPVLGRRDFERKLRRDAVKAKADAARKQKEFDDARQAARDKITALLAADEFRSHTSTLPSPEVAGRPTRGLNHRRLGDKTGRDIRQPASRVSGQHGGREG
jgi:hypothetical protein